MADTDLHERTSRGEATSPGASQFPGPAAGNGYVWPTWRDALLDAHSGINRARERRREVFQAAFDAGLSCRQIADAVGLTPQGVHKVIGVQGAGPGALDAPAFQPSDRAPGSVDDSAADAGAKAQAASGRGSGTEGGR